MTGLSIGLNVITMLSYRNFYKRSIYDKTIFIFLFHILDSKAF
jgi:hypothetical protein